MKKIITAVIIIIILLGILYVVKTAIVSYSTSQQASSTPSTSTASSTPIIVGGQDVGINDVDNGTYLVWGQTVTMMDGRYKNGTSPATTKNFINTSVSTYTIGDINGDGHDDALVQTATSIGNDFNYELHSLIKQNGVASSTLLAIPVQVGTVRTVDDINIGSKGVITLTLSIVPPDGAACCPTIHAVNTYSFDGSKLILISSSTKS